MQHPLHSRALALAAFVVTVLLALAASVTTLLPQQAAQVADSQVHSHIAQLLPFALPD